MVRRAVLIGVDTYHDGRIRALPGAANDAREMSAVLTAGDQFAVDRMLVGDAATGNAIRAAISDLLWQMDPIDVALFYFSGHAFDDPYGNGFLAPFDMDPDRPFARGIRMQELTDLVRRAKNKDVIVIILDACKSGIAAGGEKGSAPIPTSFAEVFADIDEAADQVEGKGRVVLASSGPDEESFERADCQHQFLGGDPHPHGEFTYHLLEALSGGAATASADVTLAGLHSYVRAELSGQTLTYSGSGVQHDDKIHLVTATNFLVISQQIDRAEQHLEAHRQNGDPTTLFLAIRALAQVQHETISNDKASAMRKELDQFLDDQSVDALYYMNSKRLELGDDCPLTCRKVERLLAGLSEAALSEAGDEMLGLMMTLWEASRSPPESSRHKYWRRQMIAFEKHTYEPSQIRTSGPQVLGRSA